MNELDLYTLDQKSWSFLDLIGQPPLTFTITNISASGNISVVTLTASTSVVTPLVDATGALLLRSGGAGALQFSSATGVVSCNSDNTTTFGSAALRWITGFFTAIDSGTTGSLSLKTNQLTRITIANTGQLYPATDAAAAQTASGIFAGTGVPSNANGNNGDYYYRSDGTAAPTATKDHCYFKAAGAWGGVF